MSIAQEIQRLQSAKQNIKSAIELKGVSVSSSATLDEYASYVNQIPSGGDTTIEDGIVTRTLTSYTNDRVSYIGQGAFFQFHSLSDASFVNCKTVGSFAFEFCISLSSISLPACELIQRNAFNDCQALSNVYLPNCISIEAWAFADCKNLETISLPSCQTISFCAFQYCSMLTNISIPVCQSIGQDTFTKCIALTSIALPNCTYLEAQAFSSCYELKTVMLGKSPNINNGAFWSCFNLISLYILGSSVPSLNDTWAFYSTPISNYTASTSGVHGSIFVPMSLLTSYQTATNWSVYSSRFVGLADVEISAIKAQMGITE